MFTSEHNIFMRLPVCNPQEVGQVTEIMISLDKISAFHRSWDDPLITVVYCDIRCHNIPIKYSEFKEMFEEACSG